MSVVSSSSVVSIAWYFWSDVLGMVLDGAGIVDSEIQKIVGMSMDELR